MTNILIPDGLLTKILRSLDVLSAVLSMALTTDATDAALKNNALDQAKAKLKHVNTHLTTYTNTLLDMKPGREAI